jgi:hypothetical protein
VLAVPRPINLISSLTTIPGYLLLLGQFVIRGAHLNVAAMKELDILIANNNHAAVQVRQEAMPLSSDS